MKLMVYSHDAFGLGNISRMLTICQYLLKTLPDVSILVISGSPALHSLRLPEGLDYIKLPCLGRDTSGRLTAKYLKTLPTEIVRLRSHLIRTAAIHFQPDLVLVDKKPEGLQNELRETLGYLERHCPHTKRVLVLRDILDTPIATIQQWQKNNYYHLAQTHYDQLWVVGTQEIFDLPEEYGFPPVLRQKVRFCGYLNRELGRVARPVLRRRLGVQPEEPLVVVTPGGGEDGYGVIEAYLGAIKIHPNPPKTVIISGPEMPALQQRIIQQAIQAHPTVQLLEFTDDLMSYLNAADEVVAMGGYNTTCELLTLRKPTILIPRTRPVQEQWIRAQRLAQRGHLQAIHPQQLTPQRLLNALKVALNSPPPPAFRLDGLPRIAELTQALMQQSSPVPSGSNLSLPTNLPAPAQIETA
ncbi:MAG: glycosyltransferase [Cyanothece sp. SIO1E1]|nr:glycosyltransferase [Cyanothece sp. SIO1E1]